MLFRVAIKHVVGFVELSVEIKPGQFVHVVCGVMKNCKARYGERRMKQNRYVNWWFVTGRSRPNIVR